MSNLTLKAGQRLRTGGTSYEVTKDSTIGAHLAAVKPQGTRLIKATCDTCGYTVRVTKKWIDAAGTPLCPTHTTRMTAEVETTKAATEISAPKPPKKAPKRLTADEVLLVPTPSAPETPVVEEPTAPLGNSTLAQLLSELSK